MDNSQCMTATYDCSGFFLCDTSPYVWGGIGLGAVLSLSVLGAAWGIWTCGVSILGAGVRAPRIRGKHVISVVFCEAVAIYGIIVGILMKQRFGPVSVTSGYQTSDYRAGFMMFGAGLAVGVCNLVSGLCVGVCGSSAAIGDAQNAKLFVRLIVVEIFATALGLFGIIVGIVMIGGEGFSGA